MPKESKARETAFAEYNKQRRRIQNQIRRNEAKGIFSTIPVPPTVTELRAQNIKTVTIKAQTRKLSQLTGRKITQSSQAVNTQTGEIIKPSERLKELRQQRAKQRSLHRIQQDIDNGVSPTTALEKEYNLRPKAEHEKRSKQAKELARRRLSEADRRQAEKARTETQDWLTQRRLQDEIDRKRLESDTYLQQRLTDAQLAFDRANEMISSQHEYGRPHGNRGESEAAIRAADEVDLLLKNAIDAAGGFDNAMRNISENIGEFEETVQKALNYRDATEMASQRTKLFQMVAGRPVTADEAMTITEESEQSEYFDSGELEDINQSTFDTP